MYVYEGFYVNVCMYLQDKYVCMCINEYIDMYVYMYACMFIFITMYQCVNMLFIYLFISFFLLTNLSVAGKQTLGQGVSFWVYLPIPDNKR